VLAVDRDQLREAGAEARIRYLREAEPSSHLVADRMPLRRTGCSHTAGGVLFSRAAFCSWTRHRT
jgi:hypothetical protein